MSRCAEFPRPGRPGGQFRRRRADFRFAAYRQIWASHGLERPWRFERRIPEDVSICERRLNFVPLRRLKTLGAADARELERASRKAADTRSHHAEASKLPAHRFFTDS
jgi:hypothetical protein